MSSDNIKKLSSLRLSVGGEHLYYDVDEFMSQVSITDIVDDDGDVKEISLPKFEFFKLMVDTTCAIVEDADEKMGLVGLNSMSIPYKLALNTLINYKIIKKL
jgi:hypothetical protein